jgi:hypothetical protein
MRKSNKKIRTQADYYLQMMSANQLNIEISKTLVDLSKDGDAMSNVNQIENFTRILFYLRYEYKPNN